jgi:hypothetical protein
MSWWPSRREGVAIGCHSPFIADAQSVRIEIAPANNGGRGNWYVLRARSAALGACA